MIKKNSNINSLIVVTLFQIPIVAASFLSIFPVSTGWFLSWAERSKTGVPYKDFYFPMPPLGLYILGRIPLLFSDPFLAEQILNVVIWLLLTASVFLIAQLYYKKNVAIIGSTVAMYLYFSQPHNIIAGYFEFSLTFFFLGSYSLLKDADVRRSVSKTPPYFISGVLLVSSVLVKQSFLIPVVLVVGMWMWTKRKHFREIICFTSGAVLVISILLLWSLIAGNLDTMILQIMGGGGKGVQRGSDFGRYWEWGVVSTLRASSFLPWIFFLGLLGVNHSRNENNDSKYSLIFVILMHSFILSFLFTNLNISELNGVTAIPYLVILVCIAVSLALLNHPNHYERKSVDSNLSKTMPFLLIGICGSWPLIFKPQNPIYSSLSQKFTQSFLFGSFIFVIWMIAVILSQKLAGKKDFSSTERNSKLLLLVVTIGVPLASVLSGQISFESFILAAVLLSGFIVQRTIDFSQPLHVRAGFLVVLSLIMFSSANRAVVEPYSWWGIQENPVSRSEKSRTVDGIRNFTISAEMTGYYDQLLRDVNEANEKNRRPSEGTIFFGIQNQGLEILLGRKPIETRCVVMWWDVCPPKEMKESVQEILRTVPDVIVWNDPPEEVQRSHEIAFNGGNKSYLRVLQTWLNKQIENKSYVIINVLDIPGSRSWKTTVMAKIS
jgi:hypothetical protein